MAGSLSVTKDARAGASGDARVGGGSGGGGADPHGGGCFHVHYNTASQQHLSRSQSNSGDAARRSSHTRSVALKPNLEAEHE